MQLYIPINKHTVEMLGELNGGVVHVVEHEETYFVYNGPDKPADIVPIRALLAHASRLERAATMFALPE